MMCRMKWGKLCDAGLKVKSVSREFEPQIQLQSVMSVQFTRARGRDRKHRQHRGKKELSLPVKSVNLSKESSRIVASNSRSRISHCHDRKAENKFWVHRQILSDS